MDWFRTFLIFLTVALAVTEVQPTAFAASWVGTDEYMEVSGEMRLNYVEGLIEGLRALVPADRELEILRPLIECAATLETEQIRDTFDKWLAEHRERWIYSASGNFIATLDDHCVPS